MMNLLIMGPDKKYKKRNITLNDIARMSGVAKSTASGQIKETLKPSKEASDERQPVHRV